MTSIDIKSFFKDRVVCRLLLTANPALDDDDAVFLRCNSRNWRLQSDCWTRYWYLDDLHWMLQKPCTIHHKWNSSRLFCTIHDISPIQSWIYTCHIRFSIPWHLGLGINSEVFDMEIDFEIICSINCVTSGPSAQLDHLSFEHPSFPSTHLTEWTTPRNSGHPTYAHRSQES